MKTMEERIEKIKECGQCAIYFMNNHKIIYRKSNNEEHVDVAIHSMHNASTKEKLSEAYYDYIVACIQCGYSDGEVIGGIIQNEKKNNEFDVNIDSVIKSLIKIRDTSIEETEKSAKEQLNKDLLMYRPGRKINAEKSTNNQLNKDTKKCKPEQENVSESSKVEQAAANQETNPNNNVNINKVINKIDKKVNYMNNLMNKVRVGNGSTEDITNAETTAKEIKKMISSINFTVCTPDEVTKLNCASTAADIAMYDLKSVTNNTAKGVINNVEEVKSDVKEPVNNAQKTKQVEPAAAAHTEGAFNIANFIKDNPRLADPTGQQPFRFDPMRFVNNPQPIQNPYGPMNNIMPNQIQQPRRVVFPHQICGLTDQQLVEEVQKHFKVIQELPARPLYDLYNNKLLARKMKELDAKQRPNNPYLTQVNINEYIDVPELLEKYTLCFTMPCNDKKQLIIVLFNPNPVLDERGMLNYPLHIFKARKTNNNGNK